MCGGPGAAVLGCWCLLAARAVAPPPARVHISSAAAARVTHPCACACACLQVRRQPRVLCRRPCRAACAGPDEDPGALRGGGGKGSGATCRVLICITHLLPCYSAALPSLHMRLAACKQPTCSQRHQLPTAQHLAVTCLSPMMQPPATPRPTAACLTNKPPVLLHRSAPT